MRIVFLIIIMSFFFTIVGCAGNMISPEMVQANPAVLWVYKASGGQDLNPRHEYEIMAGNLRPIYKEGAITCIYTEASYVDVISNANCQVSWDLPCSVVRIDRSSGKIIAQAVSAKAAQYKDYVQKDGDSYIIETRQFTGGEFWVGDVWMRFNIQDGTAVNEIAQYSSISDKFPVVCWGGSDYKIDPKAKLDYSPEYVRKDGSTLILTLKDRSYKIATIDHEIESIKAKKLSDKEFLIVADNYLFYMDLTLSEPNL